MVQYGMKNISNSTTISDFELILNKIKKLKVDTIYPFKCLGKDRDKLRVYLSRLADRGVIIKSGRGYFYKPNNQTIVKRSQKEIALNKSLFDNDMFWSVNDGFKVQTDKLISAYLGNYTLDDIIGLYVLFGYSRLVEESLRLYGRNSIHYKNIRAMLESCEKWRLNDKRNQRVA